MGDIRIGNTVIRSGVMLSPMAGASDYAMRTVCRAHGASYAVTEMVSAKAMSYGDKKTAHLAAIHEGDTPLAVQIFGHDPAIMADAARMTASSSYAYCESVAAPAAIDINMGCPAPKIVKNGDGSFLMRNTALVRQIVSECVRAVEGTGIPVTVKIRSGWNDCKNAVETAKAAEDAGASLIVVHGRTREQMYAPPVDMEMIADVKRAVSVPVVGNGDIYTGADALRMMRETSCDGVAVGRGALGNPWIFEEIDAALSGRDYVPPTPAERVAEAIRHAELLVADKGERIGTFEARKHIAWYIRWIEGAPLCRDRVMRAASIGEMAEIIRALADAKMRI